MILLICAGISSQELEKLSKKIEEMKPDELFVIFENPRLYRNDTKLSAEYRNVKDYFKKEKNCQELESGSIFQYILRSMKHDDDNKILYLAGASRAMLTEIAKEYRQSMEFQIQIFVRENQEWQWIPFRKIDNLENISTSQEELLLQAEGEDCILKTIGSSKRKPWRAGAVLAVFVITAVFGVLNWKNTQNQLTDPLPVETETESETVSEEEIIAQAESIFDEYLKEQTEYEDAVAQIQALPKVQGNAVAQILADMEEIVRSRGAFAEGRKAADEERYEDAINCFKAVSEKDTQSYELAQSMLKSTETNYQNAVIKSAEEYAEAGVYDQAYAVLEKLAEKYPDSQEECLRKQETYLSQWVLQLADAGLYFQENGAVQIASQYHYAGIDSIIEQGCAFEQEKLLNLLNQERAGRNQEAIHFNAGMNQAARNGAEWIRDKDVGIDVDFYSGLYDVHAVGEARTAEDFMATGYLGSEVWGEFLKESKTAGIGVAYRPDKDTCAWVVLTSVYSDEELAAGI